MTVPPPIAIYGGPAGVAANEQDLAMAHTVMTTVRAHLDRAITLLNNVLTSVDGLYYAAQYHRMTFPEDPTTRALLTDQVMATYPSILDDVTTQRHHLTECAHDTDGLAHAVFVASLEYTRAHRLSLGFTQSTTVHVLVEPPEARWYSLAAIPAGAATSLAFGVPHRADQAVTLRSRLDTTPLLDAPVVTHAGDVARLASDIDAASTVLVTQEYLTANGDTVTVVFIPGTQAGMDQFYDPTEPRNHASNVMLMGTNPHAPARVLFTEALASVTEPGDQVILAGHSQGGILAHQALHDEALRSRIEVRGVVTYGAPVGGFRGDDDVPTIHYENVDDVVPLLDASLPPDGVNRVTVRGHTPELDGSAHSMPGYAQIADAALTSGDPSHAGVHGAIFAPLAGATLLRSTAVTWKSNEDKSPGTQVRSK